MNYRGGSVTEEKRKNGKSFNPKHWRVCLSFTFDEKQDDGTTKKKRRKVQRIVEGTKSHAYEVRDQLIAEYDDKGNELDAVVQQKQELAELDELTLTKMIGLWEAARKTAGKASERTIREDRYRLKHVERHLGNVPVKDINAQMVESTYAAIREERGLSGTSMNEIHTLLKNVFQKAIDYDYIYKNPCAGVATPRRDDPNRRALSAEEGARLLREVNKAEEAEYAAFEEKEERRRYREDHNIAKERNALRGLHTIGCVIAVRLGLATGMRRGEVFGLKWGNVNLARQTIRVCQSAAAKGEIKTPKTQAGIRTLAIDDDTCAHLTLWKQRQADELAKIRKAQTDETPVCCSDVGGWYRIDNFEHWWAKWREEHGFPGLKYHELRHTQATQLLANGVDVKTVQTRMGHANSSITLDWYAHAIPENDHAAAQMLGNLFARTAPDAEPSTSENAAKVPSGGDSLKVPPKSRRAKPVRQKESRPAIRLVS